MHMVPAASSQTNALCSRFTVRMYIHPYCMLYILNVHNNSFECLKVKDITTSIAAHCGGDNRMCA